MKRKSPVELLRDRMFALHSRKRQGDVLKGAASGDDSLGITGEEWDRQADLLPCPNGVISLQDGALLPGRPEWYHRAACATPYNPAATAPRFEQFLTEVFGGDAELVAFVKRLIGYSLRGRVTEHVLAILWGEGRNGKGTLLEAIGDVLGSQLAGPIDSAMLLQAKFNASAGGPRADICDLRGKRLIWASETNEGRRMDAGQVKWLVGGDTLVGRRPYAPEETRFAPSHLLLLLTNHKPRVSADDQALWDRLRLIPFTQRFVDDPQAENEHPRDPDLREKLRAEAPGILAELVRGCLEYQAIGLRPPATVFAATTAYRQDEDELAHFVDARCVLGDGVRVGAAEFYGAYKEWCESEGLRPIGARTFGERMTQRFAKRRASGGRGNVYHGVGLQEGV